MKRRSDIAMLVGAMSLLAPRDAGMEIAIVEGPVEREKADIALRQQRLDDALGQRRGPRPRKYSGEALREMRRLNGVGRPIAAPPQSQKGE